MRPAVSILMPVREGRFLARAMETLLTQTLRDFEFVIVDDASDARTQSQLADYAKRDGRVRVERREASCGLAAALNFGIARCNATLIARADADDEYHPERLERQVAAFRGRPRLGALSSGWRRIDERGRTLYTHRQHTGPDLVRFFNMFGATLLHPGTMLRAEAVTAVNGYDPAYWTAQDTDLWARMVHHFELDNLAEPLVSWREHGTSITARRGAEGRELSLSVRIRQQRAYLGTSPPTHLVEKSADLLGCIPRLSPSDVMLGERYLAQLLAVAQTRETRQVTDGFRKKTAFALLQQVRWAALAGRPRLAAALAGRAALWQLGRRIESADPILGIGTEAA